MFLILAIFTIPGGRTRGTEAPPVCAADCPLHCLALHQLAATGVRSAGVHVLL